MKESKDHYVAQTYLRQFLNENGKLWVYHKKYFGIQERSTKSVCREAGWSDNPYFDNPRIIEEFLSIYEKRWGRAVETISRESISWDEYQEAKPILAGYLAYLKLFPPAAVRAGQAALESIVKAEMIVLRNQGLLPPPPKGFEFLLDDLENQVKVEVDHKYPHTIATRILIKQTQVLTEIPWIIVHNSTGTPFLTSDNPACNWFQGKSQLGKTFLPLSPKVAILILPQIPGSKAEDKDDTGEATSKFVADMNTLVIKCAEQRVISNLRSQQFIESVKQYHDWHYACLTSNIQTPSGVFLMQKWAPVQKK